MSLLYDIISASQIPKLARAYYKSKASFVCLFHGVHKKDYNLKPGAQKDITIQEFDAILEWLSKRFQFISVEEFLNGVKGGVCITFDDGFANNFENALPILEKYNAPALWFVTTQHIKDPKDWLWFIKERALSHWPDGSAQVPKEIARDLYDGMSVQQLSEAAKHDLITIGAHMVTHKWLTTLADKEIEDEMTTSNQLLRQITNQEIKYFAYPKNLYNHNHIQIVKRNYEYAFSVKSMTKTNKDFQIPRVDLYKYGHSYLDLKFCGIFRPPFEIN